MEGLVTKIILDNSKLKNLPLFFKTIYYNEMTKEEDEMKLMKFNKKLITMQMRQFYSSRLICKTLDTDLLKKINNEI